MLIEAFSEAKNPSAPETNEDRFVILPGRAYAVIDGVTDRLGTRYDGMLSGQYAATIVKGALEHLLSRPDGPRDGAGVIRAVTEAIRERYRAHGMLERATTDWNHRFSATLALALMDEDRVDIALVGDSGIRIDGSRIEQVDKDLDRITSTLRQRAWPVIGERVSDPALQEKLARRITWFGTRQALDDVAAVLPSQDVAAIEAEAVAVNARALPDIPLRDIERLVQGGIVHAQGAYQNDAGTVLGYSAIDGFEVPLSLVRFVTLPRREVATLELFTDGYFKPGESFGVASWDQAFAEVEREDHAKVKRYLSPKGSTATHWADDRTYVGVRF